MTRLVEDLERTSTHAVRNLGLHGDTIHLPRETWTKGRVQIACSCGWGSRTASAHEAAVAWYTHLAATEGKV